MINNRYATKELSVEEHPDWKIGEFHYGQAIKTKITGDKKLHVIFHNALCDSYLCVQKLGDGYLPQYFSKKDLIPFDEVARQPNLFQESNDSFRACNPIKAGDLIECDGQVGRVMSSADKTAIAAVEAAFNRKYQGGQVSQTLLPQTLPLDFFACERNPVEAIKNHPAYGPPIGPATRELKPNSGAFEINRKSVEVYLQKQKELEKPFNYNDLYISLSALADIRNWGLPQPDEETIKARKWLNEQIEKQKAMILKDACCNLGIPENVLTGK